MLRILGGPKRLCDGLTRRDLLHVGSLGLLGLGLREWSSLSRASASDAPPSSSLPGFGRAKACILLFMYGSPSQLETFDPKPEAPVEIRGEFGCIASSVPGLDVCERLPRAGAGHGQGHGHPVGVASLPDPWGCLCHDGDPADRHPAGAEPARPEPLAVHRLGGRLRRRATAARGSEPAPGDPAQPGAAVGVQQPARRRGPPLGALWRLPRPGV